MYVPFLREEFGGQLICSPLSAISMNASHAILRVCGRCCLSFSMAFCARSANSSGTLSGGINASLFTFPFFHSRITKCYKILILAPVVQAAYRGWYGNESNSGLFNCDRCGRGGVVVREWGKWRATD